MSNDGKAPPNLKTPFLQWLAAYATTGDMRLSPNNRDIRMGGAASARIAVGLSEDGTKNYIGIAAGDDIPIGSIPISSVAFARRIQDRDWLVLLTNDATNGRSETPVPLRIWFPANSGTFDPWCGIRPDETVTLCRLTAEMIPAASPDTLEPIIEVPLSLQGDWRGVEVIESEPPEPEIEIAVLQVPDLGEEETFFTRPSTPAAGAPAAPATGTPPVMPAAPAGFPPSDDSEDEDLAAAWADVASEGSDIDPADMDDIYAAIDQATKPPSP